MRERLISGDLTRDLQGDLCNRAGAKAEKDHRQHRRVGEATDPRADAMIAATPAKRAGTAEEIADAVIYFLTASNFVTGQLIAVDGGLSQK